MNSIMSLMLERGIKMRKNKILANVSIGRTSANKKTQYRKRILKLIILMFVFSRINSFLLIPVKS
jgi:hypothetical protein